MAAGNAPIKTPQGLAELATRALRVSQRHRTMLFLVDGRRSEAQIRNLAEQAGVPATCFDELMTIGLIEYPLPTMAISAMPDDTVAASIHIDLPLLDPIVNSLGPQAANYRLTGVVKPRSGSRSSGSVPRNVYRTLDDGWVCLSASTQGMAMRVLRSIGRPELCEDPKFKTNEQRLVHVAELDKIIGDFIATRTVDDNVTFFERLGWSTEGGTETYVGVPHQRMTIDLGAPRSEQAVPEQVSGQYV